MWQMVPNDFDVELIGEADQRRLFAARRKHVWHFVRAETLAVSGDGSGFCRTDIAQRHLPRFRVAQAVQFLDELNETARLGEEPGDLRLACPDWESTPIYSRGPERYDVDLMEVPNGWPDSAAGWLREDVAALKAARGRCRNDGETYWLQGAKSHHGNPVESTSRSLIEAIAFERETLGRLDARDFGIYSAYCSWRDMICDKPIPYILMKSLVETQFQYDATEFEGSPLLDLAMEVQDELLSEPIWGLVRNNAVAVSPERAVEILAEGLERLTEYQWTQFSLLNGMHSAGLFLPLAQVLGLNSWERYIDWKTQGFPPDSKEEQSLRKDVAVIRMFGDLTGEVA
jgi:hypothetical protein